MSLNGKPLDSIEEQDLADLIDTGVREGRTIDYKELLPGNPDGEKTEFLADVSSFANAAGGHLLLGMKEEAGVPTELRGLAGIDSDKEIQRLESMIRDGIAPRIPGVEVRPVPLASGSVAVLIRIPKSWLSPHRVVARGHDKFYSRNSAGKYPLDVSELRSAFLLSETATERIRQFRVGRLGKIIAGETPKPLRKDGKIVLHVIPVGVFDLTTSMDILSRASEDMLFQLLQIGPITYRYNFDGYLIYDLDSYVQVFRGGIIEFVDGSTLAEKRVIPSINFEGNTRTALSRILRYMKSQGVAPPMLVMLSLVDVLNYTLAVREEVFPHMPLRPGTPYPIDQNVLSLPDGLLEMFEASIDDVLRPAFDTVWNSAGLSRSRNYDAEGRWNVPDAEGRWNLPNLG